MKLKNLLPKTSSITSNQFPTQTLLSPFPTQNPQKKTQNQKKGTYKISTKASGSNQDTYQTQLSENISTDNVFKTTAAIM